MQKIMAEAFDVLRIPVTIFQNIGQPKANQKELNNPRPLRSPNDFSKLLYRIEVSKDLIKSMI